MSRWFRFYSDALRNPKIARLTDKEFRLWVSLLALAAENDGLIHPLEDLKHALNRRLDHLSTGVERLLSIGLIDSLAHGYEPHNWNKFQYKSDTSSERVKRHREKCNVSVTPPDTETETETDTESLEPKGSKRAKPFEFVCPDGVDPLDWQALIANRKQKRAALSEGAYRQIINKLERWANDGWPPGPIVANAAERGWTTIFETDEMKGKKNGQQTTDGRTMGRTEAAARAAIAEIGEAAGGRNAPASGTGQFPRNGGGAFPQPNPMRSIGYDPRRP